MLKKAELHVHLEGTIRPEIARKLAQKNKVALPETLFNPDGNSYFSTDFLHFLSVYDTLASVIKSPDDYYDITLDYLTESAKQGVIYCEMMYSPDHAENASNIPSINHLEAIQQAVNDAEHRHNIVGRIIITAVRHYGVEAAVKVARAALKKNVPCATGFGLGGDEYNYPPEWFKEAYEIAHDGGLQCTVHAGEMASYEKMEDAIKTLPIKRIGHGVMAMHSAHTRALLKDKGLALELCPTSNIFLKLFNNMAEHPLPLFLDEGLLISINSDDPPFMKTTIGQEYQRVQEAYGYSDAIMNKITLMALDCAFVDEVTRKMLKNRV